MEMPFEESKQELQTQLRRWPLKQEDTNNPEVARTGTYFLVPTVVYNTARAGPIPVGIGGTMQQTPLCFFKRVKSAC